MEPLFDAFKTALNNSVGLEGAEKAVKYVGEHADDVAKVLSLFNPDGLFKGGMPLPATCYNDFYKFTMMPVMRTIERAYCENVQCTFSVNIRDAVYRRQLYESATGAGPPALFNELKQRLSTLTLRKFDRETIERCVAEYSIPGWCEETLDAVCGPRAEPRALAQDFCPDPTCSTPLEPSKSGDVFLQVFVARDEKLQEDRVYIEATGPWHRVTWLETSMMQAVYETLLRDQKRKQHSVEDDSSWYPIWLAEAFCRCTRSVDAAIASGMKGALFTGRRTGGLALMMLQGLYLQHAFKDGDGKPMMLGTSSVTARYMSLDVGVSAERVPKCSGTHAHELSMVIGSILGDLDDQVGMPVSQLVGHMLYFRTSCPGGDVRDAGRKALMPMLPDTLGSRAFLRAAQTLTVPFEGPHKGAPLLSVIGAARQDSGGLEAFRKLMDEFGFTGALMASEIEVPEDLATAASIGYKLFGAGGFMGDSEKAWDPSKKNLSMAVKVLRVYLDGKRCNFVPVKTGETSDEGQIKEGKFEADGVLPPAELQEVRARAQVLATAEPKLDAAAIQGLFDETMRRLLKDPA